VTRLRNACASAARIGALASISRSGPLRSRVLNSRLTARPSAIYSFSRETRRRGTERADVTRSDVTRAGFTRVSCAFANHVRGLAARIDAERGTLYGARESASALVQVRVRPPPRVVLTLLVLSCSPLSSSRRHEKLCLCQSSSPPAPLVQRPLLTPLSQLSQSHGTAATVLYDRGWRQRRRGRRREKRRRGRTASAFTFGRAIFTGFPPSEKRKEKIGGVRFIDERRNAHVRDRATFRARD